MQFLEGMFREAIRANIDNNIIAFVKFSSPTMYASYKVVVSIIHSNLSMDVLGKILSKVKNLGIHG